LETVKDKKPPKAKNAPKPKRPFKPRKRYVTDQDGTLGIAKSIASRFGEEIGEEDFFDK
jgi:hypothetical protein